MLKRPAASAIKDPKPSKKKQNEPTVSCEGQTLAQQMACPREVIAKAKDVGSDVEMQLRVALTEAQSARHAAETRADSTEAMKVEAEERAAAAEARVKDANAKIDEVNKRAKVGEERMSVAERCTARAEGMAEMWKSQAENLETIEQNYKTAIERASHAEGQLESYKKFHESLPSLVQSIVCPLLQNHNSPNGVVKKELGDMSHRRKRCNPLVLQDAGHLDGDDIPIEYPMPLDLNTDLVSHNPNDPSSCKKDLVPTTRTPNQTPITRALCEGLDGKSDTTRNLLLDFYKV